MAVATAIPRAPSDDKRWRIVETRMRRLGQRPDALIEVLHAAQEAFGYLDTDTLEYVARSLGVPLSKVYGVATFYSFFTLKPQGEHACVVCTGTACYINGAGGIVAGIRRELGVRPGETTPDGKLSLLTARCLGSCSLAPAMILDGEVQGKLTAEAVVARSGGVVTETAGDGRPARPVRRRRPRGPVLEGPARASAHVCQAASCLSAQSDQVFDALAEQVTAAGLTDVAVKRVGCLGLCAAGPLVEVPESGRLFERVGPDDLGDLLG